MRGLTPTVGRRKPPSSGRLDKQSGGYQRRGLILLLPLCLLAVIFEVGTSIMLPVVLEVFVGFPDTTNINSEILFIGTLLPIVPVDVSSPLVVLRVVNLRYFNNAPIRLLKEQYRSERIDIVERGVSPNPYLKNDTLHLACLVQVVKFRCHRRNRETEAPYSYYVSEY